MLNMLKIIGTSIGYNFFIELYKRTPCFLVDVQVYVYEIAISYRQECY